MSASLLDDISSELLVCRICLGALRRAKTLSCRHTFCQSCLQRLRDAEFSPTDDDDIRPATSRRTSAVSRRLSVSARLVCPVCHESCPLPAGGVCRLPDDPVVAQLYSVIERRTQTTSGRPARTCEICSVDVGSDSSSTATRRRSAQIKCIECAKLMCSTCAKLHRRTNVTREHSLLDVDSAESSSVECEHHPGESVRFYCDTCHVCVCVLCTYTDQPHSAAEHNVLSFTDAVSVHQAPLAALLDDCKQLLHETRTQYHAVVAFDQLCRKVEDSIHEVATETVTHIRRRERQLVSALYELSGAGLIDNRLADNKRSLTERVRHLDNVCDAAEQLLDAVNERSGAALFLLQHRRTVDAITSSMTLHTDHVTETPSYPQQVRFEAYGLESALSVDVGRLVVDDDMSSYRSNAGEERQHVGTSSVTLWRKDAGCGSDSVQTGRDAGVQTNEMTTSSRCEASGSFSTRLDVDGSYQLMSGTSSSSPTCRRRVEAAAAASPAAANDMCDASTTTTPVNLVNTSTLTDRPLTTEQSVMTDLIICHNQQTSTSSLVNVQHCSTATDPPPLTADKSTSTSALSVTNGSWSSDVERCAVAGAPGELTGVGEDSRTTSTADSPEAMVNHDTASQSGQTSSTWTSTGNIASHNTLFPDLSASSLQSSSASDTVARLKRLTSSLVASDSTASTEMSAASTRLTALLPEIARTADVLAASQFSSSLTARLLVDIVDVGLQLTSPCQRRSTATNTGTYNEIQAVSRLCDVKWTQTESDVEVVEVSRLCDVKWTQTETDGEVVEVSRPCDVKWTQTETDGEVVEVSRLCDVKWTQTESDDVDRVDRGVGDSVASVSDATTTTVAAPIMFDKETSTMRAHQLNKNIATDSMSTADKQTWMPVDVASAYLSSAAAASRRVVSVSRGTSTPASFVLPASLIDRASSPVRPSLVDKSVMASKADALQPLDTFQAAGQLSSPSSPRSRRPLSVSPRSKLACICETGERNDEKETEEDSEEMAEALLSPDVSPKLSKLRALVPAQSHRSTSRLLEQPQGLSRNVFSFDHVVTSRFVPSHDQHSDSLAELPTAHVASDVISSSSDAESCSLSTSQTAATQ